MAIGTVANYVQAGDQYRLHLLRILVALLPTTYFVQDGLQPQDINNVVQAAVGSAPVTQVIDGDRRFDFIVRYAPEFRSTPEEISRILLYTPDENQVQLGMVADVSIRNGDCFRQACL